MVINHVVKYLEYDNEQINNYCSCIHGCLLTIGAVLVAAPSAYAEKTCTGVCKNHGDTTFSPDNSVDNSVDNSIDNSGQDNSVDSSVCTAPGGSVTGGGPGTGGSTGGAGGCNSL